MAGRTENGYTLISQGHRRPILERFSYRPVQDYTYKETPQGALTISVCRPYDWKEGDRRTGIVFFFGGGWRAGTRHQFDRQCVYLAARGMVAATADYRVKDYHGTRLEECVEDSLGAMQWFRDNAGLLGVDPDRIAAGGGSAGGYLAAAVALMGPADSARPVALVLYNPALGVVGNRELVDQGMLDEPKPHMLLEPRLTSAFPPAYVWFGTRDRLLPPARGFIERARQLGCLIQLDLADGADHGYFNDYDEFFRPSMASVDGFLSGVGLI
jgi:acetyl esterase